MNVKERFSDAPVHSENAENFVCVVWQPRPDGEHLLTCPRGQVHYGDGSACRGGELPNCALWGNAGLPRCPDEHGNWYYDNNNELVPFYPADTDILVASVDFDADTATSLQQSNGIVHSIQSGYSSGDLGWSANTWAGTSNAGEFQPTGSNFVPWTMLSGVTYEVFVRDSNKVGGASERPPASGDNGH